MIKPTDFDPYRTEIAGCCCPVCRECQSAQSDVLDFYGDRKMWAAQGLLDALRSGEHVRMSFAERVAEAKRETAVRASGASPEELAVIEMGYAKFPIATLDDGFGMGIR